MLTLKTNVMKYKNSNGQMEDVGAIVGSLIGSGDGGPAVIYVTSLPETDIQEACYVLQAPKIISNGWELPSTIYTVDSLPETGVDFVDGQGDLFYAYYNLGDGNVYGYAGQALAAELEINAGWITIEYLCGIMGYAYGGIVVSYEQMTESEMLYVVTNPNSEIYLYSKDYGWNHIYTIGRSGTGLQSEVFNNYKNIASGMGAHAEGFNTIASNRCAHAEGLQNTASGIGSHAEGGGNIASGSGSHAEGELTEASGACAHTEGGSTIASGNGSHAEGQKTTASGLVSHAEGSQNEASGAAAHAEGYKTVASEQAAHAEGYNTQATAINSHAEGSNTVASGSSSHAEGVESKATGDGTHAEGCGTIASAKGAHSEGLLAEANGMAAHVEGWNTRANTSVQHVEGKFNIPDTVQDPNDANQLGKYAHIVGNGTSDSKRSNAHTVAWDGTAWYKGDVYTGGNGQDDTSAKKLATEEFVTNAVANAGGGNGSGSIVVDSELSETSTNPLQNKAIAGLINQIGEELAEEFNGIDTKITTLEETVSGLSLSGNAFTVTPKVLFEYHGPLNDMNSNEVYPSTEYFGGSVEGLAIEYGKFYHVEYNGQSYNLYGSASNTDNTNGVPDFTSMKFLGNPGILTEYYIRQDAEDEQDVLFTELLQFLMAFALGTPIDLSNDYPFELVTMVEGETPDEIMTVFIVNNGVQQCDLKITEFDIEIVNPVDKHIQADFLQFNKEHPGYVKNKLGGVETTDMVFFDGVIGDLTLSPVTNSSNKVVGYSAPLNKITGTDLIMTLFSSMMTSSSADGNDFLGQACILVRYNDDYRVLHCPNFKQLLAEADDDEARAQLQAVQKELEESSVDYAKQAFTTYFGNLSIINENYPNNGESFCVAVTINMNPDVEDLTGDIVEGEESGSTGMSFMDALGMMFNMTAVAYTNLTSVTMNTPILVQYANCKKVNRNYLPEITEYDLPETAITYSKGPDNFMIKDQTNGYDYLVISNNGVLSTVCRCASIQVTSNPSKTSYKVGDYFNPAGMVVKGTRQDGSTFDVTNKVTCDYTLYPFDDATDEGKTTSVTITYHESGHDYTTTVEVVVAAATV